VKGYTIRYVCPFGTSFYPLIWKVFLRNNYNLCGGWDNYDLFTFVHKVVLKTIVLIEIYGVQFHNYILNVYVHIYLQHKMILNSFYIISSTITSICLCIKLIYVANIFIKRLYVKQYVLQYEVFVCVNMYYLDDQFQTIKHVLNTTTKWVLWGNNKNIKVWNFIFIKYWTHWSKYWQLKCQIKLKCQLRMAKK
jgi:hypothetical protein